MRLTQKIHCGCNMDTGKSQSSWANLLKALCLCEYNKLVIGQGKKMSGNIDGLKYTYMFWDMPVFLHFNICHQGIKLQNNFFSGFTW